MKTPNFIPPASKGAREVPRSNRPTSCVSPPANEKRLGNGRYSPNGTRWTLSYRDCHCPPAFTNTAELNNGASEFGVGASLPIMPNTRGTEVARATSPISFLRCGSFEKNGAGDSGQTVRSIFPAFLAALLLVRLISSCRVCPKYAGVQSAETG